MILYFLKTSGVKIIRKTDKGNAKNKITKQIFI